MTGPLSPFSLVIFSSSLVLFGGCAFIPAYERPAAPVGASFPAGSVAAEGGTGADLRWRTFFRDTRLRELIALALEQNRDLRVAVLNVGRSRAQYGIERSAFFPSVDGEAGYVRRGSQEQTAGLWNASLGAPAYELDLFGRVQSLNEQALQAFFAEEEARRGVHLTLVAEVARQYCALRQALEQVEVARGTLAAVEASHRLNQITREAGSTSELDLRTSEAQVLTARINILTYERAVAQAENGLSLLVGSPLGPDRPAVGSFASGGVVADIPAGLPSDLLYRRPDILEAEHRLLAAHANIGAARAAFFPTVSLSGTLGTSSGQLSELFAGQTGAWSFAPRVTVPIFDGGRRRASLAASELGAGLEVARYEKAIQTAFREVSDCLVARDSYRRQIVEFEALVKTEERRYELASERYRQGEELYLNVLSAQQALYVTQQRLIQVRFESVVNDITLYQALGGGWK